MMSLVRSKQRLRPSIGSLKHDLKRISWSLATSSAFALHASISFAKRFLLRVMLVETASSAVGGFWLRLGAEETAPLAVETRGAAARNRMFYLLANTLSLLEG